MEKEIVKQMEDASKALTSLSKKILKYSKKGIPVIINFHMINTGIVQGPSEDGWVTHYSLGGKSINISLDFPNTKTLIEAINEQHSKYSQQT